MKKSMIGVRIFMDSSPGYLEKQINDFLCETKMELVDIKFQEVESGYSVLIIYKLSSIELK